MSGVNPKISVVIPHRGRDALLLWQLRELQNQSLLDFEVIVVVDDTHAKAADVIQRMDSEELEFPWFVGCSDSRGPAAARNLGVTLAKSDIILYTGSDCIPDRNLLAFHLFYHTAYRDVQIVQGYTPWHPEVITPFYDFLDMSGMQANWNALKDDNGNWLREIPASFCLTTNYSIKRQLQLNEPFDESFSSSAWEDIELAYRLGRRGERAIFSPEAVNYHYHSYDLESFVARSRMEGYHRLTMCFIHPELGWGHLSPSQLRAVKDVNAAEILAWASELSHVHAGMRDADTLLKESYDRMGQACTAHSFLGVWDRIRDSAPSMQALPWTQTPEQLINVVSGTAAMERGDYGYALHTAQWLVTDASNNWWSSAYMGEIELACGNKSNAISAFQNAIAQSPESEWPKERVAEMLNG